MTEISPKDMVCKAADILENEGWITGSLVSPDGYCTIGALYEVSHRYYYPNIDSDRSYQHAYDFLTEALRQRGAKSISRWNDAFGQTKKNVLNTLREICK